MILPPIDLDPVVLAARVAKAFGLAHRIAYAQLAPDLTVAQHSPNFSALLAHPHEDIIKEPIMNLLWEFVGAEQPLLEVLQGILPIYRLEHINREKTDGSITYLNFQVTPLDEQQTEYGLLVLVEDVTKYGRLQQTITQDRNDLRLVQRKLAHTNEELQRLNQLKSLFLSMAAHDLQTPLSIINGYAELMQQMLPANISSDLSHFLDIILAQSQRLNRLINDLLDLDALDRGALVLKPEMCELKEIVRDVLDTLVVNFQDKEINLEINLPDKPLYIYLDQEKISRVIYNLASNAYKYTQREGHVLISVQQLDDEVQLQVTDNGYGMTEAQLSQLFQLYYRTEDAKESKVKGTGLGLYIVKMIVEAHEGIVEVTSIPKQGSTFTVHLPIRQETM